MFALLNIALMQSSKGKRHLSLALVILALLVLIGWTVYSYAHGGLMDLAFGGDRSPELRVTLLRGYFLSWGWMAPVLYVLLVTVEVVVAPLPGLMLYAPGGIIFGPFMGGMLSLIGNVLGSGICCQMIRVLGRDRLHGWLQSESFRRYDQRLAKSGLWVVFALRINPLTSSDLVSYAAGLTRMATWKVMLGTLMGMAPLCLAQAYLADSVLTAFPKLILPLVVLCLLYLIAVIWAVRSICSRSPAVSSLPR